ncbi:MAG: cobalt-precorrin-5B (C(1))-methyltransferase CbiD [Veillonellaceae bacterium]|nr:cobalt-precorrin-5B (C(1))-methyltransferase CbiD [Veillonellaceae bacterium]MDD6128741.1 cobalt-precorrin-5B (C(1))-methyltransferase CbiD [Veillonellaceae bacterium]MDD6696868.1 cobalt-precorrin-5B (C(1))-methyltransferase CbiD [Veillonellaceae bacterium]
MSKPLRGGYTTGACAAAGALAALKFLRGEDCPALEIEALDGTMLHIPVKDVQPAEGGATAEIVKFSGDDPDITNGASVFTTLQKGAAGQGLVFRAGKGVGHVTKPGLQIPVGEPSINPGPRKLIASVLARELGIEASPSQDAEWQALMAKLDFIVTISIPAGVELAKQTLNPVLGVEGGISVIGTTGVLRPMSEEGFKNSLVPQIDVALAAGFEDIVFVPGKIGEKLAAKIGLPPQALVQTSNFIGFLLDAAAEHGAKRVLLLGHIGKLVKVAAGNFYTHNRISDARLETLAAYAAAEGLDQKGVQAILAANASEDALEIIDGAGLQHVYTVLAERASARSERHVFGKLKVGTVLLTYSGRVLGMDEAAKEIGRHLGWEL